MNYNLFINYYVDKNELRQDELQYCFSQNLNNPVLTKIVVFTTRENYQHIAINFPDKLSKIHPIIQENRPSYNDFFQVTQQYYSADDNINVITNSDIIIPVDTYQTANSYLTTIANCLALSRWNITRRENYTDNCIIYDNADSQDTWIFKGGIKRLEGADFTMGIAGCDNSIAYLLHHSGLVLINPCRSLRTYHLHLSNVRNYIQGEIIQRIPPPYHLVTPS